MNELKRGGNTLRVGLEYPRSGGPQYIRIGLMDVRAADDIRISYDFERDGWKIEQAKYFSWPDPDSDCDPGWEEVAFCQAWQKEVKRGGDDDG